MFRRASSPSPRNTSSRTSQLASGSSCTRWRTPLNFGCRCSSSSAAPTRGSVRSTQPTTPRMNSMLRCQFQQPARLVENHVGLHDNGAVEAVPLQSRLEIARQKIAPQRRLTRGHPGILEALDVPEVLVRVDPHRFMIEGTCAIQISPKTESLQAVVRMPTNRVHQVENLRSEMATCSRRYPRRRTT